MKFILPICTLLLAGCFHQPKPQPILLTSMQNGNDSSYIYWVDNHYEVWRFHSGILTDKEIIKP